MALVAMESARPLVGWEVKPWSRFGQWTLKQLEEKMKAFFRWYSSPSVIQRYFYFDYNYFYDVINYLYVVMVT